MPKRTYKFIDLFAGIGGFHAALDETRRAKCVFASEWDKHARLTYAHNFKVRLDGAPDAPGAPLLAGDITQVAPASLPAFDILCGGFPCQPFSQAGQKRGFSDTRGTLFFNIEEILRAKKPAAFFLENVRGLAAHDQGRTLATITRALHDLGYTAPGGGPAFHHLVRASDHGVPQHRPRVFLVGFLDPTAAAAFAPPKKVPFKRSLAEILGGRVTDPVRPSKAKDAAVAEARSRAKADAPAERTIGFTLRCGGTSSGVHDRRNWDCYLVDGVERRLTVAQATQLQGFPDDFAFPAGVKKVQAMRQLGNSVAVPAVNAWGRALIAALDAAR